MNEEIKDFFTKSGTYRVAWQDKTIKAGTYMGSPNILYCVYIHNQIVIFAELYQNVYHYKYNDVWYNEIDMLKIIKFKAFT